MPEIPGAARTLPPYLRPQRGRQGPHKTLEAASKMEGTLLINQELDCLFIFDRLHGNPRFDKLLED
ncbi:MAG: hypothetical protein O3C43_09990 [Verrucomicrobia bacterium]|nr:hypothetical protein [Verrucomicrobiota bacterium]MDA1066822.1 hypothetical protein [Verrucomicrobiota bacterium]